MQKSHRIDEQIDGMCEVLDALCLYDSINGKLPDAVQTSAQGAPLYSWRVSILPFREGVGTSLDLNAPWDGPTNHQFAERRDRIYCLSRSDTESESFEGQIAAVIGLGTPIQLRSSKRLADVPCDTILVAEVKNVSQHWMSPGDLLLKDIDESTVQGSDGEGIIVGFADGQVWFLDKTVPSMELKRFVTINDVGHRDRESLLGPYRRRIAFAGRCGCQSASSRGNDE